MFKSLGKFFKKMFTGKHGNPSNSESTTAATPVKKEVVHFIGGGNGIKTEFMLQMDRMSRNKIGKRRASNKVARLSRNEQHRKAA